MENLSLATLKLHPVTLASLSAQGYHTLDDLRPLTRVQLLRIPNMGRESLKRVLAALGRSPVVGGPIYRRPKDSDTSHRGTGES